MFRRRPADAPEVLEAEPQTPVRPSVTQAKGQTEAKGRPTPKRSEAERRRRPFNAPADRKAAYQQSRDRDKSDRSRRWEAMKRGEEWALPDRDKGPVRKLVRDYVDSRRSVSQYFFFVIVLFVVLVLASSLRTSALLVYVAYALLLIMAAESWLLARRVRRLVSERYPDKSTRGLAVYAIQRSAQFRRWRQPSPTVKPGDKV